EKIIKTAKTRVIVIDAYVDAATFEMLDVRTKGVKADIYSGKDLSNMQKLHNTSSSLEPIDTHIWKEASHDRWLIIDETVYHCGHSLKDMGQKLSAIAQLGVDADDILKKIR
ncbi:MAG: DNA-binding protein, partial [Paludibacteraceae bacterium]|nr:DNA-binding protein [Paludibacteraceae bacterium]